MYGSPQGISAFGAGTGALDPLTLIQQPHTGLRVASWLFSLVILGCVVNEGYINRPDEVEQFCIFNRNQNACSLAVGLGSLGLVSCVLFLAVDACLPQISCVRHRKRAVLADLCTSACWSFMWFVGFCFLANQWQESKSENNPLLAGGDAARAAIAFSFFSIFTWGGLALLSLERLKRVCFEEEYEELFTHTDTHVRVEPPLSC